MSFLLGDSALAETALASSPAATTPDPPDPPATIPKDAVGLTKKKEPLVEEFDYLASEDGEVIELCSIIVTSGILDLH